jgi:hypothetical protein
MDMIVPAFVCRGIYAAACRQFLQAHSIDSLDMIKLWQEDAPDGGSKRMNINGAFLPDITGNSVYNKAMPGILEDTFLFYILGKDDYDKKDVDRLEWDMLAGARNVLKEFAPKLAVCTYHLPDDPKMLKDIILDANPNYKIVQRKCKLYGMVG